MGWQKPPVQLAIFQGPFFLGVEVSLGTQGHPGKAWNLVKPPSSLASLRPADLNASLDQSPEVEEIRTLKQQTNWVPTRGLTYPTLGKGKSSSKCHFWGIY